MVKLWFKIMGRGNFVRVFGLYYFSFKVGLFKFKKSKANQKSKEKEQ